MRRHWVVQQLLLTTVLAAGISRAAVITVNNASFETFNPLNLACAGAGCAFNTALIPGWTNSGGNNGSWQPGNPANTNYFDFLPDGVTIAYSNSGAISQTVTETAVAGVTYTLMVDIGNRKDLVPTGGAQLLVGANTINAAGGNLAEGGWTTFTATYTAQAGDAGQAIVIRLITDGAQADFDNVRLSDSVTRGGDVPEPGTLVLMGAGLSAVALVRRRGSRRV
ncbi:MAG: PEP-CTERM sorting domain-containing protein [Bryobacterales bacterium]|nr:PEP-CTERM sorting domain-containing protein [Bryobacterales bacterium]